MSAGTILGKRIEFVYSYQIFIILWGKLNYSFNSHTRSEVFDVVMWSKCCIHKDLWMHRSFFFQTPWFRHFHLQIHRQIFRKKFLYGSLQSVTKLKTPDLSIACSNFIILGITFHTIFYYPKEACIEKFIGFINVFMYLLIFFHIMMNINTCTCNIF